VQVIATAGHVDHGKSALVRALTGMEPDRWADERRRGLTIDLGFAWLTLPNGQRLALVDVPGHERFVPNMLAGVGPAPAVLFVVAADGGWMPQSAEHLAAIDALGIRHGLLAVSRADLADPGPALRRAREEIGRTSLGHVPAVAVSALTGQGLPELREALAVLAAGLPTPEPAAPVRLWVDRAFSMTGSGTVVTGTLPAGTLRAGDELVLTPAERPVRIRAIESLKTKTAQVSGVARVALNLRGTPVGQIGRGMALIRSGGWTLTTLVDVRLADVDPAEVRPAEARPADIGPAHIRPAEVRPPGPHAARTGEPRRLPRAVTVHIGSARTTARVRPFGGPFARLSLHDPIPLHVGDRLLLRDPGAAGAAWAGITGATVLDVSPPPVPRRGAAAAVRRELDAWPNPPGLPDLLTRHGLLPEAAVRAMGLPPPAPGDSRSSSSQATTQGSCRASSPRASTAESSQASPPQATAAGGSGASSRRASTAAEPRPERAFSVGKPPAGKPPDGEAPVSVAGWLADPGHWAALRERLGQAVARHAADEPLAIGLPVEAARVTLGLPDRRLVEALAADSTGPDEPDQARPLMLRDGYLTLGQTGSSAGSQADLPGPVSTAVRTLRADLMASPFRAPEAGRLRELGLDRKMLAAAERAGLLLRVGPEIVLAPGADAAAAEILAGLPQPFTTAQARQALDTTRRVAIPLLEYLDRAAVTQRLPDDRRILRPRGTLASPERHPTADPAP
jgi:selenocysteine-specific elongation factor